MKEVSTNDCLLWAGYVNKDGYGTVQIKENGKWPEKRIHRLLYEAEFGEIPEGLTIDHLCNIRPCINLDHMEVVTLRENVLRVYQRRGPRTHCNYGHELTPANVKIHKPDGARVCKTCHNRQWRESYKRTYYPGKYSKKQ